VDLIDAASYHQLALNTSGRSINTQRNYLLYEKRFLEYLKARRIPPDLDALNPVNVRQAVLWFQQRGLGKRKGEVATATFLRRMKTWAAFLAREGVWDVSPLGRLREMKVRRVERQPFSQVEVGAMLQACSESRLPERDRLLVELLLRTGVRISEATGLRVHDVDLVRGLARVLGKGNRERSVPIRNSRQPDGGPIPRALRAWLHVREQIAARNPERSGDALFLTLAGYRLTGEGGTDAIKRLGELAGVENAIPHRFRHTFSTNYLTRFPGDELGLRRILGHISKDVMADYVHLSQQTIAERAGMVDPTDDWLGHTRVTRASDNRQPRGTAYTLREDGGSLPVRGRSDAPGLPSPSRADRRRRGGQLA
jgi:integrase/recombinase XerC